MIKLKYTSWQLLTSGSNHPSEWQSGAGEEAHGGGNGAISFALSFIFSFFICHWGRQIAEGSCV